MKSPLIVLAPLLALGGCAATPVSEPPTEVALSVLMEQTLDVAFIPGREVVVSYVEIPPHVTLPRHWHPGEEFAYLLEGTCEATIDGQPVRTVGAGEVAHVPFQAMHTVTAGPQGARVLVFRVHTAGEPVRHLEEGGSADH